MTIEMMNREEMCTHLFKNYAPSFNFEKDGEELLDLALERGFVFKDNEVDEVFWINEEY